jgi:RHS repeat-associated protein
LLLKVVDLSNSHEGFKDDVTAVNEEDDTTDDYLYDANGNMIQDQNKHITSILYNHLNLPIKVSFDTGSYITYLYNATGVKINKFVYTITSSNPTSSLTEYIDGFQYNNGLLQFIFTPEGYVNNTVIDGINFFNYVYNYTDHLGNIRLSYTWDEEIEDISILEEHQYYPFGLEHKYYNNTRKMYDKVSKEITLQDGSKANIVIPQVIQVANSGYQYQYNGKEWQDELGYNMYDMDMRQYDPAIARWIVQDPIVHHNMSPYNAFDNNPVFWADPSGAAPIYNESTGQYVINGKEVTFEEALAYANAGGNSDGSNDNSESEPPINFFNIKDSPFYNLYLKRLKNYIKGDGFFEVFAHGYFNLITNGKIDMVNVELITGAQEVIDKLKESSPEFKDAMDNEKEINLMFWSCLAGAKNEEGISLINEITHLYPNITAWGFNGYLYINNTKNFGVMASSVDLDYKSSKNDGSLVISKKGSNYLSFSMKDIQKGYGNWIMLPHQLNLIKNATTY